MDSKSVNSKLTEISRVVGTLMNTFWKYTFYIGPQEHVIAYGRLFYYLSGLSRLRKHWH